MKNFKRINEHQEQKYETRKFGFVLSSLIIAPIWLITLLSLSKYGIDLSEFLSVIFLLALLALFYGTPLFKTKVILDSHKKAIINVRFLGLIKTSCPYKKLKIKEIGAATNPKSSDMALVHQKAGISKTFLILKTPYDEYLTSLDDFFSCVKFKNHYKRMELPPQNT